MKFTVSSKDGTVCGGVCVNVNYKTKQAKIYFKSQMNYKTKQAD